MAAAAPYEDLISNVIIESQLSLWSPLLYIGIISATVSTALGSIVGGSRVLQALCSDELLPRFMGRFSKLMAKGTQNDDDGDGDDGDGLCKCVDG